MLLPCHLILKITQYSIVLMHYHLPIRLFVKSYIISVYNEQFYIAVLLNSFFENWQVKVNEHFYQSFCIVVFQELCQFTIPIVVREYCS